MSRITVVIAASKQMCVSSMVALLLVVAATSWAQAQTYEVLYRFHGNDGNGPFAGVIRDAAGNFYGTTSVGGDLKCNPGFMAFGCGVVFKLDRTGKETARHTFIGGADGILPIAGLTRDAAGNLYGTNAMGGDLNCSTTGGCGAVFKLDTTGNETVLHTFRGVPDGANPQAGLIQDAAGNLYGTTVNGGVSDSGVVFKLSSTTRELTVLYAFSDGTDGGFPEAGLIQDAAGNLYGTTDGGGDLNCNVNSSRPGCGVVFKLNPTTRELTVLYAFTGGADGGFPFAGLIRDAAGNLYGTASHGGDLNCMPPIGCGVVFKLDTTGKETVLHTFRGVPDGANPLAGLIQNGAGDLYGTTEQGGEVNCESSFGRGVVFKLDTTGKETILYRFTGGTDGSEPFAGLIRDAAGNLYGTAFGGGDLNCNPTFGCGVVFKLTHPDKDDE